MGLARATGLLIARVQEFRTPAPGPSPLLLFAIFNVNPLKVLGEHRPLDPMIKNMTRLETQPIDNT